MYNMPSLATPREVWSSNTEHSDPEVELPGTMDVQGAPRLPPPAGEGNSAVTAPEAPRDKAASCLFPPSGAGQPALSRGRSSKSKSNAPKKVERKYQSGSSKVREDRKPGKRISFLLGR